MIKTILINLFSIFLIIIAISKRARIFFKMTRVRNLILIVFIWGWMLSLILITTLKEIFHPLFFMGCIFGLVIAIVGVYTINKKYLKQPTNKFVYYLPFCLFVGLVISAFLLHLPIKQNNLHFVIGIIVSSCPVYLIYLAFFERRYKKALYLNDLKNLLKKSKQ